MTVDAKILKILRAAGEEAVSGAELAQQTGASRAVIRGRIDALRAIGYDIEASPHLGYRLLASPDLLHADELASRLGKTRVIGRDIHVFQETTSTNDVIEKFARDNVKEGVVVFAESQTKGRGRLGRKWASPARKGLWFSVLLRPELTPQETTQITVASATALRRAIHAQTGVKAEIKWPNDILVSGKKIAGILTELHAELDRVKSVILGIGVDVNLAASDFPAEVRKIATSLKIELGHAVSRADLAVSILRELDTDYAQVVTRRFITVADEWEEHCSTLGRNVTIRLGERQVRGRAESLAEDGALLVRTEHGHLERIVGGDLTVEKGPA
ncbi:MAG TPA: biotin--[acetyl-CoA-carboxylase] ligase [Methylomirabilota bacterium]|nr:biotin--[acetyl-CoA-carboxylase] ligase [Methylomirabilota bacterium]